MSALTEKAQEEADRVEAEQQDAPDPTPDPAPDPAPTPEPTPEPDPAPDNPQPPVENLTEQEIEKRYNRAGKRSEKFVSELRDILGPTLMADLIPSPLDTLPGFVAVNGGVPADAMAVEATKALLGLNDGPDYAPNPDSQTCSRCNGWGDVLTGAKRQGNELVACTACNGYGYTPPPGGVAAAPVLSNGHAVNTQTGEISPQPHAPTDPRVAELRAQGYTILEPFHAS